MKKLFILATSVLLTIGLAGCGTGSTAAKATDVINQPLKVGVTAGPHEQIMEKVKELAAK